MDEPVGKIISLETDMRLNDKSEWEVVMRYNHKRSFDLIKWEERKIGVRSINKDKEKAFAEAHVVLNAQLDEAQYDLFNLEEKDLLHD